MRKIANGVTFRGKYIRIICIYKCKPIHAFKKIVWSSLVISCLRGREGARGIYLSRVRMVMDASIDQLLVRPIQILN